MGKNKLVEALGTAGKRIHSKPYRIHQAMNSKNKVRNTASEIFLKNDKEGARIGNLYTGKQVRWLPMMAIGGAAATVALGTDMSGRSGLDSANFGAKTGLLDIQTAMKTKQGTLESGESPMMLSDGSSKGSNTLGASGDIVLGLHNKRKG